MVTCHVAAFFQQLRTGIRPHAQRRHTTLSHTHLAAVPALRDIPIARTASSLRHRIACRLGRTDMAGIRLFIDTFCSGPRLYADIYMAVGNSLDIGCTYPGMVVLLHLCRIRPCPDFSYRIFFLPIAVENITDIKNTGFLVAATIIGICCGVSDSYLMTRHKIQIWRSNRFLLLLFALLILLCTINLRFLDSYLPLLHVIMAQSAGYYLIHTRNRYVLWQMGIVAIVYLFLYAWNF